MHSVIGAGGENERRRKNPAVGKRLIHYQRIKLVKAVLNLAFTAIREPRPVCRHKIAGRSPEHRGISCRDLRAHHIISYPHIARAAWASNLRHTCKFRA